MPGQTWIGMEPGCRIVTDATAVSNPGTTETAMSTPWVLPAYYFQVGKVVELDLFFRTTTLAAETLIFSLRYGSATGGVVLAKSDTITPDPTAVGTNLSSRITYVMTCRTEGTAGTVFCMADMVLADIDDATVATLKTSLDARIFGVAGNAAPAASAALDTTAATALTPTIKFGTGTATSGCTTHLAMLKSYS